MDEYAGTANVLVLNNQTDPVFYKTIGNDLVQNRTYTYNSYLRETNGSCATLTTGWNYVSRHVAPAIKVSDPLPYSFPLKSPLRLEYVAP